MTKLLLFCFQFHFRDIHTVVQTMMKFVFFRIQQVKSFFQIFNADSRTAFVSICFWEIGIGSRELNFFLQNLHFKMNIRSLCRRNTVFESIFYNRNKQQRRYFKIRNFCWKIRVNFRFVIQS